MILLDVAIPLITAIVKSNGMDGYKEGILAVLIMPPRAIVT